MRRSGQMGVPVITAGDEVIVGFDRPRLEQLASRFAAPPPPPPGERPKIGLRIKDAPGGAEVGTVHPGLPADLAGLRPGDRIVEVNNRPVRSAADLETALAGLSVGDAVAVDLRRDGRPVRLRMKL